MDYVSLHHHSTYSYMDGFGLPEAHVKRAVDLGMSSLALTEHGNVSSHVKLELAAVKAGIKPIFGLEAYVRDRGMRDRGDTRKWHQTILAMNEEGLQNLYRIVTRSWTEGFYQWPTVHWDMLRDHNEGLIVLSGCLDSKLACDLLGGKGREVGSERDAVKTLLAYKRLFGDRFYLECQRFPELPRAHKLNQKYQEWSKKYGVQLIATADCHYPMPDDNDMQVILHAAGRGTGTVDEQAASWEYGIRLTHPESDDQITAQLVQTGLTPHNAIRAVENTAIVAERCNVTLPKMDRVRFPMQDEPNWVPGMTMRDMLNTWLNDGWRYRGFHLKDKAYQKKARAQAKYEMDLFEEKDFFDYFAVLGDAVRHAKDTGLPVGPARGSAAASLCCYLWRLTEVNPMEYPLMLFERFVDPNRNDLPDIDLDFDDERRDEIRQYMIQKYGHDRVGNIGTFTRYRGKNAIDDVARVYKIPEFETKKVKEFLVERSGGDSRFDASIEDTIEMFPQAKEVFDNNPELYQTLRLEGNYKSFGVHAAGIVVGAQPLHNYVATYTRVVNKGTRKEKEVQALSVDKYDGEHLGLLKLDALGLKTMGMIRNAIEIIGMSLEDLYKIDMEDAKVHDAFRRADVTGIFQFDGRTMRMVTQELKPEKFMDLAAINALSRPGPLHSGSTGDYIAIRHGRMKRVDLHPLLTEICDETEGQIIYQEQILKITRDIGNFPWTHASAIRKIISSKKGESAFNAMWDDFKRGAEANGVSEPVAREIWKRMATAGTYAFNIAHCISYSMLGVWAQWLKQYHPLAFYAAQLRKADTDPKKRKDLELMRDMQDERFGRSYEVFPPDVKTSKASWMPAKNGVIAGFEQISGIGEVMADKILAMKEDGVRFDTWADLQSVSGIGPKTVEKFEAFASQPDPFGINKVKNARQAIIDAIKDGQMPGLPIPDTTADQVPYDNKKSYHTILAVVKNRNLQDLFENHRSRTGEELNPKEVKDPHLKDSMTLYLEDQTGLITVKVNRWKYPEIKNDLWDAVLNHDFLLISGVKKEFYGKTIQAQKVWVIDPD